MEKTGNKEKLRENLKMENSIEGLVISSAMTLRESAAAVSWLWFWGFMTVF